LAVRIGKVKESENQGEKAAPNFWETGMILRKLAARKNEKGRKRVVSH